MAVLGAALLALALLPWAVVVFVGVDQRAAWSRGVWSQTARFCRVRRETRLLRRLERRLSGDLRMPVPGGRPCIEELAAELRRLDRQRRSGPTSSSQRWLTAVVRAYDDRLRLASRCLGVTEHLDALAGVERDLERERVEAELESAGLSLRSRF